jgi:hypothetical protein
MSPGIAQEVVDIAWRIYSSLKMHITASKSNVYEHISEKEERGHSGINQ